MNGWKYWTGGDRLGIWRNIIGLLWGGLIAIGLISCAIPQVQAEDRLFLDLSLEFLGAYELPQTTVDGVPVGGLSGLTYDRPSNHFYAISDDRSNLGPARFYTLSMAIAPDETGTPRLQDVAIDRTTTLLTPEGIPFASNQIDPEGIALSPGRSLFISSEGSANSGLAPSIQEFDLETGQWMRSLPIPERFVPQTVDDQPVGIQDNLAFESLTLNPGGHSTQWLEPFRLFTATESSLQQDRLPEQRTSQIDRFLNDNPPPTPSRNRFLHYLVGDPQTTLIAEHLYLLDSDPPNTLSNGLSELLLLDAGGHFLSLERTFDLSGFGAKIFQLATGSATDISGMNTLPENIDGIEAIRKQLVLDLSELEIELDNLEGMTLGPQLPDGNLSLVMVSDNNFDEAQITQLLLFRLRVSPAIPVL